MLLRPLTTLLLVLCSAHFLLAAEDHGKMIEGVLITNTSTNPRMRITSTGPRPKVGEVGELQKYFQRTIMSGWLGKGSVKITGIKGNILSFKVLKEESIITMNGVAINHFTKGTKVQIFWGAPKKLKPTTPTKTTVTTTTGKTSTTTAAATITSFPKAISPKVSLTEHPVVTPEWKVFNTGWNDDIVVSDEGWIVAVSRSYLHFHEAENGATQKKISFKSVCDGGLTIHAPNKILAVTGSWQAQLWEITTPACTKKSIAVIDSIAPEFASFGPNTVVIGGDNGRVLVYDIKQKKELSRIKLDAPVASVAISPNEKVVAIGTDSSELYIHDIETKKTALFKKGDRDPDALSFSPDGSKLFTRDGSFKATVYSAKDGTVLSTHSTGSWLVESHWISNKEILASGSDGILIYTLGMKTGQKLAGPDGVKIRSGEGIGISPNRAYLCASDRNGTVLKFSVK